MWCSPLHIDSCFEASSKHLAKGSRYCAVLRRNSRVLERFANLHCLGKFLQCSPDSVAYQLIGENSDVILRAQATYLVRKRIHGHPTTLSPYDKQYVHICVCVYNMHACANVFISYTAYTFAKLACVHLYTPILIFEHHVYVCVLLDDNQPPIICKADDGPTCSNHYWCMPKLNHIHHEINDCMCVRIILCTYIIVSILTIINYC